MKVLVAGAGSMGQGIAQVFVDAGFVVDLFDQNPVVLEKAKTDLKNIWNRLAEKKKISNAEAKNRALRLNAISETHSCYEIVIEAIVEDLDIKKTFFQEIVEKIENPDCLYFSNTSSLSITGLFSSLKNEQKAQRCLGLHFFNPAPLMKLVEIVPSPWVAKETIQEVKNLVTKLGKVGVVVEDSPGFIVNRVARSFYGEALRIVEYENIEHMKEVDRVMEEVGGFKMGPFALMDLIGIDVNFHVTQVIWESFFYHPRYAPHPLQRKMVVSKRLGKKTKRGFYNYD